MPLYQVFPPISTCFYMGRWDIYTSNRREEVFDSGYRHALSGN